MISMMKKVTVSLCVLAILTGCATVPSPGPGDPLPEKNSPPSRVKTTLLVIGSVLLLGAVIANEIEDSTNDAIRDGITPQ